MLFTINEYLAQVDKLGSEMVHKLGKKSLWGSYKESTIADKPSAQEDQLLSMALLWSRPDMR